VAFAYLPYAHCRRCGNLDLQRISHRHVEGMFAWLGVLLHIPAYRCAPCRSRFFSILKNRHFRPVDEEIPEPPQPAQTSPEETETPTPVGTH
jgi:hypothetical protein